MVKGGRALCEVVRCLYWCPLVDRVVWAKAWRGTRRPEWGREDGAGGREALVLREESEGRKEERRSGPPQSQKTCSSPRLIPPTRVALEDEISCLSWQQQFVHQCALFLIFQIYHTYKAETLYLIQTFAKSYLISADQTILKCN